MEEIKEKQKISVLMSVYKNDKPEWFADSLDSVCKQTLTPDEVVVIIDGPVPQEILDVIKQKKEEFPFIKDFPQEKNMGLGNVLNIGVPLCSNEIIARMDSDDVAVLDRFEKQLAFMTENDLDIVGSDIEEFCTTPDEIVSVREVPKTMEEISEYIKSRNPFNHMTVLMKKSKVLSAGGYQDMHYCEDYYLWCRMYLDGAKMANMSDRLVKARMNTDTFKRRGGYKYFKSQKRLFKFMRKNKIMGFFGYYKTLMIRFVVHVLMPGSLKEKIYKKHLRKSTNEK